MNKATYFKRLRNNNVQCTLCPFNCKIPKGGRGHCNTRINIEGALYSLAYGEPTGLQNDPIEKKPLYHYNPGAKVLSFGTQGCNLRCDYCLNYYYSQAIPESITAPRVTPEEIVTQAINEGCEGIAYTYNEPTIFLEYAKDTMKLARNKGLFNIFVTNGVTSKQALQDIDPYLDAAVIDFKGFNPDFYRKHAKAELEWVKQSLKTYSRMKCHKEVTNLVIPGFNNEPEEVREFSKFIINTLGDNTPVHFLKFYPTFRMNDIPETPKAMLKDCYKIAKEEGLNYVYVTGNNNTHCIVCNQLLIKREHYAIKSLIKNGKCPKCESRADIKGVIHSSTSDYINYS